MDASDIGKTGKPQKMRIEFGKIREFARAIKDDNPLYHDEGYAQREIGGVMPPPTFSMTMAFWDDGGGRPQFKMDLRRILHGEQEFEYLGPVYAGDVLTATTRVSNVFEKEGSRGGKMTLGTIETEFVNQKGEKVLVSRSTLIETAGPVKKE
jgi:acyl dehydratase